MKNIWFFLLLIFLGCTEDSNVAVPLVQTGEVIVTEQGITLTGLVTNAGKEHSEVGFVWDVSTSPTILKGRKISTQNFSRGSFSIQINNDLLSGQQYYVKAYGTNGTQVIYGSEVKFTSKGSLAPVIDSFEPSQGTRGTIIKVKGSNFSTQAAHVIARLGQVEIETTSSSENELTLKVPSYFPFTGAVTLSVEVAKRETISKDFFTLDGPTITSISPMIATSGDTLRIFGTGFSPVLISKPVNFGGVFVIPIRGTSTYLDVVVPGGIKGSYTPFIPIDGLIIRAPIAVSIISSWSDEMPYSLLTPSQVKRTYATAFVINGEAYYGAGLSTDEGFNLRKDFWKFSPITRAWTSIADFPGTGRYGAISFSIGNIGYVGMGSNAANTNYSDLWAYDPSSNTWTRKADHPVAPNGSYACFVLGNKAYYGIGSGSRDFWQYDPVTNAWTSLSNFPGTPRSRFTVFTGNGKAYLGIGLTSVNTYLKDLWEYNPLSDQWIRKRDLPSTGRENVASVSRGTKGLVVGGRNDLNFIQSWEYDMVADQWIQRSDMPRNDTNGATTFTIDKTSYVVGGASTLSSYQYFTTYLTYQWK